MSNAAAEVDALIKGNNVVVFSRTWCPFCKESKGLLSSLDVDYTVVELDKRDDGEELKAALVNHPDTNGQTSVPNIFIGGTQVGGNSDLKHWHSTGKLKKALQDPRALAE